MVWEGYTVYVRYWTQLRAACGPVVTAVVGIPWRCGVMYAGHADYILLWLSVRTGLIQVESKTDRQRGTETQTGRSRGESSIVY